MRSKKTWLLIAALLVLGSLACSETTELTSAPASSPPLKSSAVPSPPASTDAR